MKVLFLNPPFKFKVSRASRWPEKTKSGTLYYPFWLCHAAGWAEKKGYEVKVIDSIANDHDFDTSIVEIMRFNPGLVVIDTCTSTIMSDIEFVNQLKSEFKCKVVLVGPHVSALPKESLKDNENVDFIARYEYDYTIVELAEYLQGKRKLEDVHGITYRSGKMIVNNEAKELIKDLDSLPFVSKIYKKFLDVRDYRYSLAKHPMIQVFSSRGCPNKCTFCNLPQTFSGRIFRSRSPENFVEELEYIKENMPEIKEIFIEDDTFTTDKERVMKICDMIIEKKLNIVWSANVRVDVPYEVLEKMKQAGCRILITGYESGNQEILNKIKKGITLQMSEEFTKNCKQLGIKIFGCFMIGLPGDTKETIQETFEFSQKLLPDMVFFQHAVPFPGTEFYNWCEKNDYITVKNWNQWLDLNGQLGCIVSYPNLSAKEICELRDDLMIKYYTNTKHILYTLKHNLDIDEIKRLSKAGKDFMKYLIKRKKK